MLIQTWKMAWSAVFANKLRTFLTMLGIIIGVSALIILVSIADGATGNVSEQISSIGSNYLMVQITDDKENPLRLSEFSELIRDNAIEAAAPVGRTSVTVKSGYTSGTMAIYGTSGSYFDIMNLELSTGRTLKKTDLDNNSYVIVITEDTAVELFGHTDVEGENISLDGRNFQIIGVLAEDETTENMSKLTANTSDEEEESVELMGYIPYSTLSRIGNNTLNITQFYVSSKDETSMDDAESAVEDILLERLKNDEDAFSIVNQSQIMEAMNNVKNTLSLMLGGWFL